MFLEDPYEKIEKFRKEMDKLFNRYLKELDVVTAKGKANMEKARVNIKKVRNGYEYAIEVPGVDKEDITVNIIGNIMEVKATKQKSKKNEKKNYLYQEFSTEEYYRAMPLPEDADPKKVKAKYENGVLKITIGRKKRKEISKKVKIE